MKALIVSGGNIEDTFAQNWIGQQKFGLVLAADSGMDFFYRTHRLPDVIVGDMDSVSKEAIDYFQSYPQIHWETLNPVKDDTDTEFSIRYAIAHGAEEIIILGATGTRLDHVLANISLLGIGIENGIPVKLVDSHNRIRMIDHSISIQKEEQFGKYVSLIPCSRSVTGVTLKGMKYPLTDYDLKSFSSLGISNEILEETAEISFQKGLLLLVESCD